MDKDIIQCAERFGKLKGIVDGHTDRIETCEKDRDDLFDSRNDHENRLITIETYRKAEDKYDGKERRGRSVTFGWIMNIVMALVAITAVIITFIK